MVCSFQAVLFHPSLILVPNVISQSQTPLSVCSCSVLVVLDTSPQIVIFLHDPVDYAYRYMSAAAVHCQVPGHTAEYAAWNVEGGGWFRVCTRQIEGGCAGEGSAASASGMTQTGAHKSLCARVVTMSLPTLFLITSLRRSWDCELLVSAKGRQAEVPATALTGSIFLPQPPACAAHPLLNPRSLGTFHSFG